MITVGVQIVTRRFPSGRHVGVPVVVGLYVMTAMQKETLFVVRVGRQRKMKVSPGAKFIARRLRQDGIEVRPDALKNIVVIEDYFTGDAVVCAQVFVVEHRPLNEIELTLDLGGTYEDAPDD